MTELSTVRSLFHSRLDARLNIDAAAQALAAWSDKVAERPILEWLQRTDASQELYRLLTYTVLCAAVSDDEPADLAFTLDISVDSAEKVLL